MPTLGGANRAIMELQGRVLQLEQAKRNANGSAFTDEQTKQINAIVEARASFFRLVLACIVAISTLAASLIFTYIKLRG